jgi:hypothetical protein
MMGGGEGGLGGGFCGNDSEDDFFGGGKKGDKDEYNYGKKNKADNNDPLAFLQRA